MKIITGAAGFIGSCMVEKLNSLGMNDLVLVDDFSKAEKKRNWENKKFAEQVQRDHFFQWTEANKKHIDFIVHLGARTDTGETDKAVFEELNFGYSRKMWELATACGVPLLYASSAATYGDGKLGYDDDTKLLSQLEPLNEYANSKHKFDKWAIEQMKTPPCWAGFKFFNVYGPNEYHKGRMASAVFHGFNEVAKTGKMTLFKSHNPNYKDGEQMRDFIYVKDVVNILLWFMQKPRKSDIYNLGTGFARPFLSLANAVFKALDKEVCINWENTPLKYRDKYQYYTQAEMKKLRIIGFKKHLRSIEPGIRDYIKRYLQNNSLL